MVVISSGALSFSAIAAEFGISAPYSLSTLIRGGAYVPNGPTGNANIPTTASMMRFSHFYGAIKLLIMTISTNQTNYNLYTAFVATYGTPSGAVPVQVTINAGVTIGATSTASPAFDVGQFPTGTTIDIINNGNIWGAGGAGGAGGTVYNVAPTAAGNGGTAIKANYLNQTVTITNNSGATIYGGGGGGGGGGKGATGANGTNGIGPGTYQYKAGSPNQACWQFEYHSGVLTYTCFVYPSLINGCYSLTDPNLLSYTKNGNTYFRGQYKESLTIYASQIVYFYEIALGVTTLGGTGGAGGNGGAGATGRGYNNQAGTLTGSAGSAGSAGTTGGGGTATDGQPGSAGGTGGNSGSWGASGSSGSGTAPGSSGAAGNYLLKGLATVSISGSGTTAGTIS